MAVINGSDPMIRSRANGIASRKLFFTGRRDGEDGADITDENICLNLSMDRDADDNLGSTEFIIKRRQLRIPGKHNAENVAASGLATLVAGGTLQGVLAALNDFEGLTHRLEYIATINDVSYYNDSKATNIDAVIRALACFRDSVILIMGGRNKGGNFYALTESVRRHVKEIIALGEARQEVQSTLGSVVSVKTAATMEEAVKEAADISAPGNIVLLSPACSSFDMYEDYAHRGAVFTEAVKKLQKKSA